MSTMKRISVVGLLVAAVVLGVPEMVSAAIPLSPPPDGPFQKASGSVSTVAFGPYFDEFNNKSYDQYFVCKVSALAPTTSYYFVAYYWGSGGSELLTFQTDDRGRGAVSAYFGSSPTPNAGKLIGYSFAVYDLATGRLVLSSD